MLRIAYTISSKQEQASFDTDGGVRNFSKPDHNISCYFNFPPRHGTQTHWL